MKDSLSYLFDALNSYWIDSKVITILDLKEFINKAIKLQEIDSNIINEDQSNMKE